MENTVFQEYHVTYGDDRFAVTTGQQTDPFQDNVDNVVAANSTDNLISSPTPHIHPPLDFIPTMKALLCNQSFYFDNAR